MIYENNTLKRILVDGGYYEPSTSKYYFYLTDHLGNNRVVADQTGAVRKVAATSTKAVQATMSNSITTTATTLTTQGASQGTVNAAVNSVTKGMSTAGSNTVNTMIKVEAATATATETTIKVAEEQLKMRGN